MKLFGREPAAWVGLLEAALTLLVVLKVLHFTSDQTALVMAVVVALFGVLTAYLTKDTMLGFVIGLVKAVIALFIGFGISVSPELTAALIGFVSVFIGFFQRTQTSPDPAPSLRLAA